MNYILTTSDGLTFSSELFNGSLIYLFTRNGNVVPAAFRSLDSDQIPTCLQNGSNYFLATSTGTYMAVDPTLTDQREQLVFRQANISGSEKKTYFQLRDPRKVDLNTFLITQQNNPSYYTVTLTLSTVTGQPILFNCSTCSCGSLLNCDSITGNCLDPTCSNGLCKDNCNGRCDNGGVCTQAMNGTWSCIVDCAGQPCGGLCYGGCPPGLTCNASEEGFVCEQGCVTGICGGICNGTCPVNQVCTETATGYYQCVPRCDPTSPCQGTCQGLCSNGEICRIGPDNLWSCQSNAVDQVPIWKKWWFWVAIIVALAVFIGIILLIVRDKGPEDDLIEFI